MKYEKKYNSCKTLDIDTSKRQVKVAIAEIGSLDRDNDVFDSKAFTKTLKENGPQGTNEIWHLLDHEKNSFAALSKFKEVGIDGNKVYGVSQYKDSYAWREVACTLYEAGDLTQHSVGFSTLNDQQNKDGSRTITDVRLWEGSAVLWGANPNTPTMQVTKAIKDLFEDSHLSSKEYLEARFDKLIKRIQDEKFTDQNKNLLTIELLQIQDYATSHATETKKFIAPSNKPLLDILTNFTKSLNTI